MRWFISIRYFLSHKRQSLVCILGVAISVTMFITMTALMHGLTDKFIIETVESSGHITIHDEPRETRTPILERAYSDPNALLVTRRAPVEPMFALLKNVYRFARARYRGLARNAAALHLAAAAINLKRWTIIAASA